MGWLIALGVLTGLAILPLGVSAIYNIHGPFAYILVGPFRIKIYPSKNKDKTKKEEKPKAKEKPAKTAATAPQKSKSAEKKGGSIMDFLPLVDTVLDFLGSFRRKLRVKCLEMKLVTAGDDPCDLAVNYGKAWAVLGNLMPLLERAFVIKKRDLEVECDFTADKTLIYARLDLTITLGRIVSMVTVYGVKILCQFLKIMKSRKGGAKT